MWYRPCYAKNGQLVFMSECPLERPLVTGCFLVLLITVTLGFMSFIGPPYYLKELIVISLPFFVFGYLIASYFLLSEVNNKYSKSVLVLDSTTHKMVITYKGWVRKAVVKETNWEEVTLKTEKTTTKMYGLSFTTYTLKAETKNPKHEFILLRYQPWLYNIKRTRRLAEAIMSGKESLDVSIDPKNELSINACNWTTNYNGTTKWTVSVLFESSVTILLGFYFILIGITLCWSYRSLPDSSGYWLLLKVWTTIVMSIMMLFGLFMVLSPIPKCFNYVSVSSRNGRVEGRRIDLGVLQRINIPTSSVNHVEILLWNDRVTLTFVPSTDHQTVTVVTVKAGEKERLELITRIRRKFPCFVVRTDEFRCLHNKLVHQIRTKLKLSKEEKYPNPQVCLSV